MSYKFRSNADHGKWCSVLLPCCLFPFMINFGCGIYLLLFSICLCTVLISTSEEIPSYNHRWLRKRSHIVMFSLLSSLFIWYFFLYNFLLVWTLCLFCISFYCHLVQNLLINCPGSFTYGEAQVISQGVMMFILYSIVVFLSKVIKLDNFPVVEVVPQSLIFLLILLLGCLLLIYTLSLIPILRQGIYFIYCCIVFSSIMIYAWQVALNQNIFFWMLLYCFQNKKRVLLILFCFLATFSSIAFVVWANRKPNYKASTFVRKYFHLIICIIYVPGIFYDLDLLRLASGIALTAFIVLEMFRILNTPIIGPAINNAFDVFLDEKDSGTLILTNIYLLIGCSSPIWLTGYISGGKGYHISLLSGIISVGLGDAAASVGGTVLGKHYWPGSNKTFEGSACAIVTQLIASFFFLSYGHELSLYNSVVITISAFLTSFLEAKTTQVDNLVLPLFMFSILSWIN